MLQEDSVRHAIDYLDIKQILGHLWEEGCGQKVVGNCSSWQTLGAILGCVGRGNTKVD